MIKKNFVTRNMNIHFQSLKRALIIRSSGQHVKHNIFIVLQQYIKDFNNNPFISDVMKIYRYQNLSSLPSVTRPVNFYKITLFLHLIYGMYRKEVIYNNDMIYSWRTLQRHLQHQNLALPSLFLQHDQLINNF